MSSDWHPKQGDRVVDQGGKPATVVRGKPDGFVEIRQGGKLRTVGEQKVKPAPPGKPE